MESEKQVIAVKRRGIMRESIIALVLGVVLFALGVIMFIFIENGLTEGIVAFFGGIICILFGIVGVCSACTTPAEIITYEGGLLHFADGTTCEPWEIENLTVLPERRRYYDLNWGSLVVIVRGEYKTYENIVDVQEVYEKLRTLIKENLNSGERTEWTEVREEEETDGEFDG